MKTSPEMSRFCAGLTLILCRKRKFTDSSAHGACRTVVGQIAPEKSMRFIPIRIEKLFIALMGAFPSHCRMPDATWSFIRATD